MYSIWLWCWWIACSVFKEQPLSWPCENPVRTAGILLQHKPFPPPPPPWAGTEDALAQGIRLPPQINVFFFPGFYFSNLFLSYYLCSALQFRPFLFALLPTLSWYSWITCLSREHPDLIHSCILTWWWIFDFLWLSLAENSESGDSLSVIICLNKTPFPKSVFSRGF